MNTAVAVDNPINQVLASLMEELHDFVTSTQRPMVKDYAWALATEQRCRELSARVAELKESAAEKGKSVSLAMEEMAQSMRDWSSELAESPRMTRLKELHARLSLNYEQLVSNLNQLREPAAEYSDSLIHLKPVNYKRNVFHVGMGALAIAMYEFVLPFHQCQMVLLTLSALAVTLETTRRFSDRWNLFLLNKVFGLVARPREVTRVNGASFYTVALTLMAFMVPPLALEIGILVLAFGDPAATIAGKKWGVHRLWRQKTAIGTSAFVVAALAATLGFLAFNESPISTLATVGMVLSVVIAGALTELFTDRLDDNFTIPVVCSGLAAMWLVF